MTLARVQDASRASTADAYRHQPRQEEMHHEQDPTEPRQSVPQGHNHVSEELRTLPAGSPVVVTKDDGSELHTTTRSTPWQIGGPGGTWVVSVDGIGGGYALSRVRKDRKAEATAKADRYEALSEWANAEMGLPEGEDWGNK